jgi:hypothetical protein
MNCLAQAPRKKAYLLLQYFFKTTAKTKKEDLILEMLKE